MRDFVGYTINNRNRYKCNFCDHSTYKTFGGVHNHLNANHELEYKLALKDRDIERLKNKPPKVEIREKVVYRDQDEPKYWYPKIAGIYCPTCRIVNTRVGIPVGQTIENTPHNPCKNRGLMPVVEVH